MQTKLHNFQNNKVLPTFQHSHLKFSENLNLVTLIYNLAGTFTSGNCILNYIYWWYLSYSVKYITKYSPNSSAYFISLGYKIDASNYKMCYSSPCIKSFEIGLENIHSN